LLAAAFRTNDVAARHIALEALRAALLGASPDDTTEVQRWESRLQLVLERLKDPEDRPRAAAVLADVAAAHAPRMANAAAALLAYSQDPDSRVRTAVLRFVGHARLDAQVGWVIQRLVADDPAEAAAAVEALNAFGPTATNHLLHWLNHGKRAIREAVFPILRDVPVNAVTLRALIDREIVAIRHLMLQRHALRTGSVSDLVLRRLAERIAAP